MMMPCFCARLWAHLWAVGLLYLINVRHSDAAGRGRRARGTAPSGNSSPQIFRQGYPPGYDDVEVDHTYGNITYDSAQQTAARHGAEVMQNPIYENAPSDGAPDGNSRLETVYATIGNPRPPRPPVSSMPPEVVISGPRGLPTAENPYQSIPPHGDYELEYADFQRARRQAVNDQPIEPTYAEIQWSRPPRDGAEVMQNLIYENALSDGVPGGNGLLETVYATVGHLRPPRPPVSYKPPEVVISGPRGLPTAENPYQSISPHGDYEPEYADVQRARRQAVNDQPIEPTYAEIQWPRPQQTPVSNRSTQPSEGSSWSVRTAQRGGAGESLHEPVSLNTSATKDRRPCSSSEWANRQKHLPSQDTRGVRKESNAQPSTRPRITHTTPHVPGSDTDHRPKQHFVLPSPTFAPRPPSGMRFETGQRKSTSPPLASGVHEHRRRMPSVHAPTDQSVYANVWSSVDGESQGHDAVNAGVRPRRGPASDRSSDRKPPHTGGGEQPFLSTSGAGMKPSEPSNSIYVLRQMPSPKMSLIQKMKRLFKRDKGPSQDHEGNPSAILETHDKRKTSSAVEQADSSRPDDANEYEELEPIYSAVDRSAGLTEQDDDDDDELAQYEYDDVE